MLDTIGVVTVTRRRPELLRRAMASVHRQDYRGDIEHVVVIDDDPESLATVEGAPSRPGLRLVPHLVPRPPAEAGGSDRDRRGVYPRLARLFNTGTRVSSAQWIAFLDDDNEFEPHHLRSLRSCALANSAQAVHSGRQMFRPDGSPYLDEVWHTTPDPAEGARIFRLMCDLGVRVRGTNVLMDRVDPAPLTSFRTSSVMQPGDPVSLVDQSVWLIRRELLLALPIPETFTDEEHAANTAPDDKLLYTLRSNGVPIFSSGQPTVRYYLGGVSNNYRGSQLPTGTART